MQLKNSDNAYGLVAICLHWLMAVLLIILFALGEYMEGLDYYDAWYHTAPWIHKSIGIIVFALLISRTFWRFITLTPAPIPEHKNWEVVLAKSTHWMLYLIMFVVCISGYLISTAEGAGIEVFGWFSVADIISYGEMQAETAGSVHGIATKLLLLLFVVHLLGVMKHRMIDKDKTLTRIIRTPSNKEHPQ